MAQIATPGELLNTPQTPFVADFIGRDRGYRKLSFCDVGNSLSLKDEPSVALGSSLQQARQIAIDPWVLVTHEGKALGWLDTRQHIDRAGMQHINLGATFCPVSGSLRHLLDAALSSPCHRAVLINDQQQPVGSITLDEVLNQCKNIPAEVV